MLKDTINIFLRELKKIFKDSNLISIFILAPLSYPLLYGLIYVNKVETNIPVGIRDDDNSYLSRSLIRDIDAHQNIEFTETVRDQAQTMELLSQEKVQAVLHIPKHFSENLKKGEQTAIKLTISPGRLLVLSDVGLPVSAIASTYGGKVTASVLARKGVPVFQNKDLAQPIKLDFKYMFNPYMTYGDFILPALLLIIVSQIVIIGAAAASAKEWSLGKWHDMFAVSKNYLSVTIGKHLTYLSIFGFFSIFIYLVIVPMYNVNIPGNILNLFFIFLLGIITSSSFGLFLGTFFHHRITVFVILGFTTYPFFMASGFAWPSHQMPEAVAFIANILPLVPFLKAFYTVSQMQNEMSYAYPYLWNMLGLSILYSSLFMIRLRKLRIGKERQGKFREYVKMLPR